MGQSKLCYCKMQIFLYFGSVISDKCLILPPSNASQLPLISALFPLLNPSDDGEKLSFLQAVVATRQPHCFFNFFEAFIGPG